MKFFSNLPVWKKLVTVFLFVGLLPMVIIGMMSVTTSNAIINDQVSNQLSAVRTIKANEVERYFERVKNQITTLSSNPLVISAASQLPNAFAGYRSDAARSIPSLAQQKNSVINYYEQQFGSQFQTINGESVDTRSMYSGLDAESWALQYQYIAANPNELGAKDALFAANDGSEYSKLHADLHPMLRNFLQKFGYYDIFIADPNTGDIIYSVFKELDYTTSLVDGPYSNSSIGDVFRKAQSLTETDQTALGDFQTYLPSYNAPASFMASPIVNGAEVVGILIFQMPIEDINAIMSERAGMGDTGETYLVGSDYLMRSDSYLEPEYHNVVASFKHPVKGSAKTDSVTKALSGKTGTGITSDYNGNPVLSAYMPLQLGDITWAVLSEQDVAEAFAPAKQLRNVIFIAAILCAFGVIAIAYFIAKLISTPIKQVMDAILSAEKTGSFDKKVNYKNKDEIGQMANAFDGFIESLSYMFSETNKVLKDVSSSNYQSRVSSHYSGDMKLLAEGVNSTIHTIHEAQQAQITQQREIEKASDQAKAKAIEAEASATKAEAAALEANRVRQALDVAGTAVLMTDSKNKIIYFNQAMKNIFSAIENHVPGFSKANITDSNTSLFRDKKSGESLNIMAQRSDINTMIIADYTFAVSASPIMNGNDKIGTVIEWKDRTVEVDIEKEIDTMVTAAAKGDFSVELETKGKDGFFLSLAQGLNTITGNTKTVIHDVARALQRMSEGDLTNKIETSYSGTFSDLTTNINLTMDKLVTVISHINDAANQVSSGAREIEAGIIDLSGRTEQQAASLEETASSMNEMLSSVSSNASKTSSADTMSKDAERCATEGGEVVKQAINAMQSINSSSKQIADITSVIDDIAFQTNLLALNAAVEAARAGEQGRGFAVVASEVRNLAQRSSQAAREIKELINDSVEKVETGTLLVNRSGETLDDLVKSVAKVSSIISELSSATTEQDTGIRQVNSAVSKMDEMTQQNSALVEEATAASENMASQAKAMTKSIGFFRTH